MYGEEITCEVKKGSKDHLSVLQEEPNTNLMLSLEIYSVTGKPPLKETVKKKSWVALFKN